jgi:hypothetical protein
MQTAAQQFSRDLTRTTLRHLPQHGTTNRMTHESVQRKSSEAHHPQQTVRPTFWAEFVACPDDRTNAETIKLPSAEK